ANDRCIVYESSLGWQVIDRQGELVYFKENAYAAAENMDAMGDYDKAIAAFEALNGYGDSDEKALQAREKINTSIYASAEALVQ
ncbi:hypothetical protein NL480_28635, partial [Klebsiella pneumoniae]|nr:hypothetical protein [Klebsiella pneumoniae]